MFVDASAMCAMITNEEDAALFSRKLESAKSKLTSPLAVWETAANVARILKLDDPTAQNLAEGHLEEMNIRIVAVEPTMTSLALEAYRRYGKGRHPAALNFGDCFAYACAKHHRVPLLFKGNDFNLTDIEAA